MKGRPAVAYEEMPLRQVELLDAAARAFTEMGFSAATIDSVADLIGVTKGSVYYYYRSKTDLFFAVHRRAMQLNLDAVEPLAADLSVTPARRLWNMAHAHTHLMMAHLPYQRVTVQGIELRLAGRTTAGQRAELEELVQLRDRYESLFRSVVEAGVAAGQFRAAPPALAVKPLLGALNWTTLWYRPREGETEAERESIAHGIADAIVGSVMPLPAI
ncbi:TetR/AcrR family transcriptional regulator [Bordetella bronchiseptica]|uniref:TetR/AcrR family transcriptional regulator n=1 Tax=Bordetella bronchiseptica TaxID=518 RepID=UPI00046127C0|nr:TetR/AcrR family transcriptional regulator [Bordetella bronchiseptica]KDD25609.1 transcriptional regulator, TetR family [Bordetella bronchiseptica MBORD782]VTQ91209.1 HTH-type transcriptional repressor KstR2 [Bordetella bronchiseptica]